MELKFSTSIKERLDDFLRRELPERLEAAGERAASGAETGAGGLSNSKIRRLILSGSVFVNGRECRRPAFEIRGLTKITVNFESKKFFYEKQPDDIDFVMTDSDVLFEDENLIFVNKPAFLPVEQTIAGNRKNLHDALVDYLWKRNPELRNPPYAGIMHRLDRETSGVILFTKSRSVNKAVHDMFESHNFTKTYLAVCEKPEPGRGGKAGRKPGDSFTVEMFMNRVSKKSDAAKCGRVSEKDGGLYSKTDFKICGEYDYRGKAYFVIECNLFTGRTHQIRVHLASLGMPLLGDQLYGGPPADRIYLHAWRLACDEGELKFDVRSPCRWQVSKNT